MKKKTITIMAAVAVTCAFIMAGCGGSSGGAASSASSKAAGSSAAASTAAVSSAAASSAASADAKVVVGSWQYETSKDYVYTFNEDGTGDYTVAGSKKELTYTIEGGKLSILFKGDTAPFKTDFKVEGNKLIIKDSLDKDVVYVKK